MIPPILRDFPEQFETERLLIRAPLPGDGAEVNAAILESLDRLRPWMEWVHPVPSVDDTEANIRQARADFLTRTELRLHLYEKTTGAFVGSSGLHRIDWRVPKMEIGYWVRTRYEGQGYVTEAVRGITRFAFETLGARRVEIRCDANNARSARVAERAGYRLEARLRSEAITPSGALRDTLIYALLADEWERGK
ncbi:GNAT family N-acetyltransferase [Sphaerobacter thermophilus]|jgi:RimJ/RimL family protein N-acetyltransferase|uniref:GCN5-related N-acetyltransferase n=1 Tax=Sphaerobacter thermophilus (strain ATCC 49802 / DSM 20745 / KCCM 41009 / NCIMB 13125 / S 6022) TaxID=479434 RepID=D1C9D0_SPHTD|nr:GNAT family protein [Sphaerobacter thermophilus]ACZ40423.1 GCN5-related N-acetyltransferase [Sphaerobacter thermophilus DSM 20745]